MSIAYDPFKWADIWESEEEYINELLSSDQENSDQDIKSLDHFTSSPLNHRQKERI